MYVLVLAARLEPLLEELSAEAGAPSSASTTDTADAADAPGGPPSGGER